MTTTISQSHESGFSQRRQGSRRAGAHHLDDLLLLDTAVLRRVAHVRHVAARLLHVLRLRGLDLALHEALERGLCAVRRRLHLVLRGALHRNDILGDVGALRERDEVLERGLDVHAGALALCCCEADTAKSACAGRLYSEGAGRTNGAIVDIAVGVYLQCERVAGRGLRTEIRGE